MAELPKSLDENCLKSLKENYKKVQEYMKDTTNEEDKSEPYKTKYAALEILKNMRDSLYSIDNSEQNDRVTCMLGVIYLNMGIVYIEIDELKSGEEYLMKCIESFDKDNVQVSTVFPVISALNQLGILWSKREQPLKAKYFLERAEITYKDYKKNINLSPVSMSSLFEIEDDSEISSEELLEKLYTLTLYYIAQIYGSLEKYFEAAIYCHSTLCRQLEQKDFDSINWALDVATLSQFFMEKCNFALGKHHLGAASYVLQQYKKVLEKNEQNDDEETLAAKWEIFNHRSADVAICWAKYGIMLLSFSRDRLIEKTETDDNTVSESPAETTEHALIELKFTLIENEIEKIVEGISDKYLLDFDDASAIFKLTKKRLNEAKEFYCLENHASDYVQIIQDMSHAYKYLAFFEFDEGRRAKMHKRRIDILESVVKELNPTYYLTNCREIWTELGEIYLDIKDIKRERLRNIEDSPPNHLIHKINHLTSESIRNFTLYIDSIKELKHPDGFKKLPDEMIRPALYNYFILASLYHSYLNLNNDLKLENIKKSLEAYTFIINYCEKDSKASELMFKELDICKSFVKLLPLRINKMLQQNI